MVQDQTDAATDEDSAPAPAPVAAKAGPLVQKKIVPTMTQVRIHRRLGLPRVSTPGPSMY